MMNYFRILKFSIVLIFATGVQIQAQTDTSQLDTNDLLTDIALADTTAYHALIPDRFLITQRILWGQKGLMRNFDYFELTPEKRQKELKIRRTMLVSHQVLGFVTLAAMIAQGVVGERLYNGESKLNETHEALGATVNFCYFSTAGLALFTPPICIANEKGLVVLKYIRYFLLFIYRV